MADLLYRYEFRKSIAWNNPTDINEWINWLSFKTDTSEWSKLSDKYRVRELIAKKGYKDTLIPLFKIWETPEQIKFEGLPKKFILKMNNYSGDSVIIDRTKETDLKFISSYFKKCFKKNYSTFFGELHYSRIKPILLAEKYLDYKLQAGISTSLIDYKIWCFNGKVEIIEVIYDRTIDKASLMVYDSKWRAHPEYCVLSNHFKPGSQIFEKPYNFERMKQMAMELSLGFPQMRVDLYEVNKKLYFGEITMTAAGGRKEGFSEVLLNYLGECCKKAYFQLKNDKCCNSYL